MRMRNAIVAGIAVCLVCAARAEDQKPAGPGPGKGPIPAGISATNLAGGAMPFPAIMPVTNIAPEELQRVMKMRSKVEELNRALLARRNALYAENEEIKKLQAEMREIQKKIDAILDKDPQLKSLKEELDAVRNEQHIPVPSGKDAKAAPHSSGSDAAKDGSAGAAK